jgi:hypothetical protein
LAYGVRFGDADIGHHIVTVTEDARGLIRIEHQRTLRVRLFFVTAYERELHSTEYWDAGPILVEIDSHEVKNGDFSHVTAKRRDTVLRGKGPNGHFETAEDVATTESLWVRLAMEKPTLLDTYAGEIDRAVITSLGQSRWRVDRGEKGHADLTFGGDFLAHGRITADNQTIELARATA